MKVAAAQMDIVWHDRDANHDKMRRMAGTAKEAGADLIPSGAITFSTIPAGCPAGWSEFIGARGFMVVGLPLGGSVGNTVGSALTDLATSTHTHSLSAHTHTFTGPGHTHTPGGHTHLVDAATHDHGAGNHSHDNFDPDGGSPHSHTMTNSHTHSADPGATTMPANDNNSREGGVAGGPYNITGHSHTLNVPSFNTELGGPANTGTDNFTNKNSSTASGDRTAFFDISSQPSGVPSVDNTGSRAISNASASPSTDATDGKDVSFPYLQLWVCQKN